MAIIPLRAGKLAYQKYKADGTLDETIITTGLTVQSIDPPNLNISTQDVPDGNSLWPLAVVETDASSQVVVNFSDYSPKVLADMTGGNYSVGASVSLMTIEQPHSVPDDYTITLPEAPASKPDVVVTDIQASPWVKVDSAPTKQQFSVSGSVVTFNSADAGAEVLITYAWESTGGEKMEMPEDISVPTVRLIISDSMVPSNLTGADYDVTYYVDKARVSGDVKQMTQQKTPGTWTWTWRVIRPRAGRKPFDINLKRRTS